MRSFFLSVSFIVSVKVRIFPLNMCHMIVYVAQWWEKYLSKRSPFKHTSSWRDKLIVSDHNLARIRKIYKDFARELHFKFSVKITEIHKLKKSCICISIMKRRKNIQSMCEKILSKDMSIYYWYEKKEKSTIFLSKILIHSCIIIEYIVEQNIFVVTVYKVLVWQKY